MLILKIGFGMLMQLFLKNIVDSCESIFWPIFLKD